MRRAEEVHANETRWRPSGCWTVALIACDPKFDPAKCDGLFDPDIDCWPDADDDFELTGFDDRARFPSQPDSAFLTKCDEGALERFEGDLDFPRPDGTIRDFPVERSCTECRCSGSKCERVRRYIVRNRVSLDQVQTFIPVLDPLCNIVP